MGNRASSRLSRPWRVPGSASLAAAVLGVVMAACGSNTGVASAPGPLTTARCQNLVVPAYFYPGADWTRIEDGRPVPRIMIMDAAGPGAGSAPNQAYQDAAKKARDAGITILGYSDTSYGRRPASVVEDDVRKYRAWYGVYSIFLDQVSSSAGQLPYYRQLARYIHSAHRGAVVLNPGTYPDQRYMSVGDIIVAFENTYATYARLQVPGWVRSYPVARFAHIVYATTASQLTDARALAVQRHAGYVYITDRNGPQRYSALPGYWDREDAMMARCAAGQDGAVPTATG